MRSPSTLSPTRWCHRSFSTVRLLEEVWGGWWGCSVIDMLKTLFFTETSGNSITAFSSPSWQAGWWNNMLWFSENYFQINLCEARDSPFSTSIQSSGLDCCWQQLPRRSFCSCQIILQPVKLCVYLCPQFPDSRQGLLSAGAKLEVKIFSLLWCLFIICAVNVSSQFTLAGGERRLASHLNTKVNYWTHLATIQFQLLKGQKSICTSLGELHHCKEFLWGYLMVNNNALRHPGYGSSREGDFAVILHLWKLRKWQSKPNYLSTSTIHHTGQILLVFLE